MENYKTGIDPFLYQNFGYNNLVNLKDKFEKKDSNTSEKKADFSEMLNNKRKLNDYNISTNKFSSASSKKEILNEIKTNHEKRELYEAAEQFEAYFMEKVFKEMKKNVPKKSLIHGGYAEEIFDEMLLTERIRDMAHYQEFGLAEMVYDQMSRVNRK